MREVGTNRQGRAGRQRRGEPAPAPSSARSSLGGTGGSPASDVVAAMRRMAPERGKSKERGFDTRLLEARADTS